MLYSGSNRKHACRFEKIICDLFRNAVSISKTILCKSLPICPAATQIFNATSCVRCRTPNRSPQPPAPDTMQSSTALTNGAEAAITAILSSTPVLSAKSVPSQKFHRHPVRTARGHTGAYKAYRQHTCVSIFWRHSTPAASLESHSLSAKADMYCFSPAFMPGLMAVPWTSHRATTE